RQDTIVVTSHGARAIPAWASKWYATCPAMPSAKEQIADHLANRRVRPLTGCPSVSQARSAYAAYASTPTGKVMDVSRCSDGRMPGSGETSPNPVLCAMPTQPVHTSAAAGAARTSSGQDRTVPGPEETAADRSPPAGPVVLAVGGPPGPRS